MLGDYLIKGIILRIPGTVGCLGFTNEEAFILRIIAWP